MADPTLDSLEIARDLIIDARDFPPGALDFIKSVAVPTGDPDGSLMSYPDVLRAAALQVLDALVNHTDVVVFLVK